MSSQTNCFQHVMLLEIPDLESVDHFPILAAVIGILLALLEKEMKDFGGKQHYNFCLINYKENYVYEMSLNNLCFLLLAKSTIEIPRITRSLLTEPSFQINSLRFVLSDTKLKNIKTKNIKPFSLLNCKYLTSNYV